MSELAHRMKIIAPERFKNIVPPETMWQKMHHELAEARLDQYSYPTTLDLAVGMAILQADGVTITNGGIELISPAQLKINNTPEIPELRKF